MGSCVSTTTRSYRQPSKNLAKKIEVTLKKQICNIKSTLWMNSFPGHNNTVGTLHFNIKKYS